MKLSTLLDSGKRPNALGLDDTPFQHGTSDPVSVCGIVTDGTRFDGMLWGEIERDGLDATSAVLELVAPSKFAPQLHVVLTDGITMGGMNVLDLPALHAGLDVPIIGVMRRRPDLERFRNVMNRLSEPEERWRRVEAAGEIYEHEHFVFQCVGCDAETAIRALRVLTDRGHVPECLRLAHLIGSAVKLGQSGRRA